MVNTWPSSEDADTQKTTQFGALAGQIQYVTAQKMGLKPRQMRHTRAELETSKLGGAQTLTFDMQNHTPLLIYIFSA